MKQVKYLFHALTPNALTPKASKAGWMVGFFVGADHRIRLVFWANDYSLLRRRQCITY